MSSFSLSQIISSLNCAGSLLPVLCVHSIFQAYDMSDRHQISLYVLWGMSHLWAIRHEHRLHCWIHRSSCFSVSNQDSLCSLQYWKCKATEPASGSEGNTTTHHRDTLKTWRENSVIREYSGELSGRWTGEDISKLKWGVSPACHSAILLPPPCFLKNRLSIPV